MWNYFLSGFALILALPFAAHGQTGAGLDQTFAETLTRPPKPSAVLQTSAIQIQVQCGNPTARVKSIADGLKLVGTLRPAVLLISGTCHEDVDIEGLDSLTLQGNPTATIDGGSDPNSVTVGINGSRNIALNNLTITGGGQGLSCAGQGSCLLTQVTLQNSLGDGAGVGTAALLELTDSVVRNNANAGLRVGVGSAVFFGGSITGNGTDGVQVRNGGLFAAVPGNLTPNVTIQNNSGNGIRTSLHNTILLNSALITGNSLDGVTLQMGSALNMFDSSITNNGGHQVRIGDLSIAQFAPGTVTGPNYPEVVCDPQFSTTRNLRSLILIGTTTNCPAELPPTP